MQEVTAPNLDVIRKKFFPAKLANGYEIRPCTQQECYAFVSENIEAVFGPKSDRYLLADEQRRKIWGPMHKLRESTHDEFFLFSDSSGKTVGWSMGESEDWITFYMRNTGILKEHQENGIYSGFLALMTNYCSEIGYERISSHHKGTNRRILSLKMKAGFYLVGLELTERWGSLFKVVKFLREDRRKNFVENYGEFDHI